MATSTLVVVAAVVEGGPRGLEDQRDHCRPLTETFFGAFVSIFSCFVCFSSSFFLQLTVAMQCILTFEKAGGGDWGSGGRGGSGSGGGRGDRAIYLFTPTSVYRMG